MGDLWKGIMWRVECMLEAGIVVNTKEIHQEVVRIKEKAAKQEVSPAELAALVSAIDKESSGKESNKRAYVLAKQESEQSVKDAKDSSVKKTEDSSVEDVERVAYAFARKKSNEVREEAKGEAMPRVKDHDKDETRGEARPVVRDRDVEGKEEIIAGKLTGEKRPRSSATNERKRVVVTCKKDEKEVARVERVGPEETEQVKMANRVGFESNGRVVQEVPGKSIVKKFEKIPGEPKDVKLDLAGVVEEAIDIGVKKKLEVTVDAEDVKIIRAVVSSTKSSDTIANRVFTEAAEREPEESHIKIVKALEQPARRSVAAVDRQGYAACLSKENCSTVGVYKGMKGESKVSTGVFGGRSLPASAGYDRPKDDRVEADGNADGKNQAMNNREAVTERDEIAVQIKRNEENLQDLKSQIDKISTTSFPQGGLEREKRVLRFKWLMYKRSHFMFLDVAEYNVRKAMLYNYFKVVNEYKKARDKKETQFPAGHIIVEIDHIKEDRQSMGAPLKPQAGLLGLTKSRELDGRAPKGNCGNEGNSAESEGYDSKRSEVEGEDFVMVSNYGGYSDRGMVLRRRHIKKQRKDNFFTVAQEVEAGLNWSWASQWLDEEDEKSIYRRVMDENGNVIGRLPRTEDLHMGQDIETSNGELLGVVEDIAENIIRLVSKEWRKKAAWLHKTVLVQGQVVEVIRPRYEVKEQRERREESDQVCQPAQSVAVKVKTSAGTAGVPTDRVQHTRQANKCRRPPGAPCGECSREVNGQSLKSVEEPTRVLLKSVGEEVERQRFSRIIRSELLARGVEIVEEEIIETYKER